MSDPFVGEIRIFASNFAPTGWAECNGQLMPISQNTALFSLLGTQYGGNGKSNFALPDLQGRAPLQHGQGPGLSERVIGEAGGARAVSLLTNEIPAHAHQLMHTGASANTATPGPAVGFARTSSAQMYAAGDSGVQAAPTALHPTGSGVPHNNMQPYLTLMFCIALHGVFPARW